MLSLQIGTLMRKIAHIIQVVFPISHANGSAPTSNVSRHFCFKRLACAINKQIHPLRGKGGVNQVSKAGDKSLSYLRVTNESFIYFSGFYWVVVLVDLKSLLKHIAFRSSKRTV